MKARLAVLLVLVLAGVSLASSPIARSAVNPDVRRVLFVRNADIYSVRTNGLGLQRLTFTKNNSQPEWSPNSTKVVFVSTRDGDREIFTMNPDGSGVRQLTRNRTGDTGPTWSPKGNQIAFEREFVFDRYDPEDLWTGWALWVMNGDGSNQHNLTPMGRDGEGVHEQIHDLVWAPNGEFIAGTGIQWIPTQDFAVYVFDLEGNVTSVQMQGGFGVGFASDGDVLGCAYDGLWKWLPTDYYESGQRILSDSACGSPTMSAGLKFVSYLAGGVLRGYEFATYMNRPLAIVTGNDPYDWSPSGRMIVAATSDGLRVVAPDLTYSRLIGVRGTDPNW